VVLLPVSTTVAAGLVPVQRAIAPILVIAGLARPCGPVPSVCVVAPVLPSSHVCAKVSSLVVDDSTPSVHVTALDLSFSLAPLPPPPEPVAVNLLPPPIAPAPIVEDACPKPSAEDSLPTPEIRLDIAINVISHLNAAEEERSLSVEE
jgi:hypothetical protein